MANSSTLTALPFALGIELPGGGMRTFLEVGTLLPTTEERVRFVSRLRERTRLRLRLLERNPEGEPIRLGELHLGGIKLNPQGEAQLLISIGSQDGEWAQVQIVDELGNGRAEAAFRTSIAPATAMTATGGGMSESAMHQLLARVTALEAELELKYTNGSPAPVSINGSGPPGNGPGPGASTRPDPLTGNPEEDFPA